MRVATSVVLREARKVESQSAANIAVRRDGDSESGSIKSIGSDLTMSLLNLALSLLNRGATTEQAKLRASLARTHRLTALLPYAHPALLIVAAVYLLLLPSVFLARDHYVSENALQPAQVNTYWNWADVHVADNYAKSMDRWVTLPLGQYVFPLTTNLTRPRRSTALLDAFQSLGLPAATQSYTYTLPNSNTVRPLPSRVQLTFRPRRSPERTCTPSFAHRKQTEQKHSYLALRGSRGRWARTARSGST